MAQDMLMLSGLQHFAFCRRQWALIHIEQQWAENVRTVEGNILHRRAHDARQLEARGDLLIARGMRIKSDKLGVTGVCDVVEFRRDKAGIELAGHAGRWQPYPVEYKRGQPKENNADELQLCGQAMCLEEMLVCTIPEGSLFYGETRRRKQVVFTPELRGQVAQLLTEMHQYFDRGYTPRVRRTKACNACSLKDLCLPQMTRAGSVHSYIQRHLQEDDEAGGVE